MCDSDNEDTPFYFELEVDDEISFKAPYKPAPKKIETSRKSFSMPQFALKNLASTSDRFKSTENDDPEDKENMQKSNSCQNTAEKAKRSNSNTAEKAKRSNCSTAEKPKLSNTAEKPRLPPSSAEKLLRYSMNSAVSFIENFSAMLPRDVPSFQTIEEGADESFEAPNAAEDCDLSEAEMSAFKMNNSSRMIPKNLTDSRFDFESSSNDDSFLSKPDRNINVSVSMINKPGSNDEEQDRAVDLNASIRSDGSCQSYGTATGEELEDPEGLFSDSVASLDPSEECSVINTEECSVSNTVCSVTSLGVENEIIDQSMQIESKNDNENKDVPKEEMKVAPVPLSAFCPFPSRIVQKKVLKNSDPTSYQQNAESELECGNVLSSKINETNVPSDASVTLIHKEVEVEVECTENKENFAPLRLLFSEESQPILCTISTQKEIPKRLCTF